MPDTNRCEAVAGDGAIGLVFDDWGHRFVAIDDALPFNLVSLELRYQKRLGSTLPGVVDTLPTADDARLLPIAPARFRVEPEQSGFLQPSGYLEIFRGNRLTRRCQGSLFVCQPETNLLHSRTLRGVGAGMVSERADPGQEFLASNDPNFRPVQATTGPDGRMYVVDFYRPTLERPVDNSGRSASGIDVNLGEDFGRLWRIVSRVRLGAFRPQAPAQDPQPPRARLSFVDDTGLVRLLQHANGWWRETAQRLLIERNAHSVEPELRQMFEQTGNVRARLHAMWTLEGLGLLNEASLVVALNELHPYFTANVIRAATPRLSRSPALRAAVLARARDRSASVRFQVALAIAELSRTEAEDAFVQVAQEPLDDSALQTALLMNVVDRPRQHLQQVAEFDPSWFTFPVSPRLKFLHQLAQRVGVRNDDAEINALLEWLGNLPQEPSLTHLAILDGLQQGMARANRALADLVASPPANMRSGLQAITPVVQYGRAWPRMRRWMPQPNIRSGRASAGGAGGERRIALAIAE